MRLLRKLVMLIVGWFVIMPVFAVNADPTKRLNGHEIRTALTGNFISYYPAGMADAGIHEEFHEGGFWRGKYYSRGPMGFTGHWMTRNGQLCVSPDKGTIVARWFSGDHCRAVWRDKAGQLFLEHLNPHLQERGLLPLKIESLKVFANVR